MPDYTALKNLILAQAGGSAVRVAYAAGNDVACAAAVNALAGAATTRDAEFGEWQAWLVRTGTLAACRTAAADALKPAGTRALAQQVVDLYYAKLTVIYYDDAQAFGAALVNASIITQGTLDVLIGALSVPRSKPVELWGATVTVDDVTRARGIA